MFRRTVMIFMLFIIASPLSAENVVKRWASGEVIAINTEAAPNTIVVKSKTWKGQDFIVGAAVEAGTVIMINKKPVQLKDVHTGDRVDITYERNLRVIAKTIKVKR